MNKSNVTIGMGQLLVDGGEPDRNLQRAYEMSKEESGKGCDILSLSVLQVCPYSSVTPEGMVCFN